MSRLPQLFDGIGVAHVNEVTRGDTSNLPSKVIYADEYGQAPASGDICSLSPLLTRLSPAPPSRRQRSPHRERLAHHFFGHGSPMRACRRHCRLGTRGQPPRRLGFALADACRFAALQSPRLARFSSMAVRVDAAMMRAALRCRHYLLMPALRRLY